MTTDLRYPALLGPTASGKTALVVALAERLPVEVISVDSALVYRGLTIGTAKPTPAEQACCPHHLIDLIEPEEVYTAGQFVTDAQAALTEITARRRLPLFAGGTMLYAKTFHEGIADLPNADPALRAAIDARAAALGWPAMHAWLAERDPETAARLAPNDRQRIQRALEVLLTTGQPLSMHLAAHVPQERLQLAALLPSDRDWLHRRIAERFAQMLAAGFIDEVATLRARGTLTPDHPSMRTVGYRQIWRYLDGKITRDEMVEAAIAATRQLAKRQITWLRQFAARWPDAVVIDPCTSAAVDAVATWLSRWWESSASRMSSVMTTSRYPPSA